MEAKAKTKTELTKEKTQLNKDIKSKKAELELLSSKIKDLDALSSKREQLQIEVDELTKAKKEVGKLTVNQQSLEKEVRLLGDEKKKLNSFIKKNTPKKEVLETELNQLESKKVELDQELTSISEKSDKAKAFVGALKKDKEKYESEIRELKEEYGLYPRDMKELTKDSIKQIGSYSKMIVLTTLFTLALVLFLIFSLVNPILFNGSGDFWLTLTSKVLLTGALLFVIVWCARLIDRFVSQYVRAKDRLTNLRTADYLIGKARVSDQDIEQLDGELNRDAPEITLLQSYIPKIMNGAK